MKHLALLISLFFSFPIWGQEVDSMRVKLASFIQALQDFSRNTPQEKVYLHFDNTSYYQGDNIWFKCYVVTAAQHQLSRLSKTLYVELLNPGGEVVDKRTLKIENGQCHGEFTLNHLPFYSGFYEVRAYTKYMLSFGEDAVFSRLLPVFNSPKEEGNFEEKEMLSYNRLRMNGYPMKRESPLREKRVNLRFFPEGGNLVQGVESRVAFEATDEFGNPIEVTGVVMDGRKQELCKFATWHEGRGMFTYTPNAGKGKNTAEVEYLGKKYSFDLPTALPQGVVMEVGNLSYPDSIKITLRKSANTPAEVLGVAVLNGGKLQSCCLAFLADTVEELNFKMDKKRLPSGVSQVVLFNSKGDVLSDRLIFTNKNDVLSIKAKANKPAYRPHEFVEIEMSVADKDANPISTTFSLSVRDGKGEVRSHRNILTDLLLMSEVKGYVSNPFYYFEKDDSARCVALDLLLMVQGWRRYSWKQMAGVEKLELKYRPEQGVEVNGKVVTLIKQKPKPNVDVTLILYSKEQELSTTDFFVTDEQGRFSFVSNVQGAWDMLFNFSEKGKKKDYMIALDRLFSPKPKRYSYAELQVNIAEGNDEKSLNKNEEEAPNQLENNLEAFFAAYKDSLDRVGIGEKMHHIEEVRVKAKKRTREQDILRSRTTSVAYYDAGAEKDNMLDGGKYVGNDIHELLKNMNEHFSTEVSVDGVVEFLFYKIEKQIITKFTYQPQFALVVINYEQPENLLSYQRNLNFAAIKSIYINESLAAIRNYMPYKMKAEMFGCAVFIETYPEGQIPVEGAKGVRKTMLEGYSPVKEFYSPNYSELPPVPDYRRTLYWNPSVATDENGKAKITFYNNSRCEKFGISAETITEWGEVGIY